MPVQLSTLRCLSAMDLGVCCPGKGIWELFPHSPFWGRRRICIVPSGNDASSPVKPLSLQTAVSGAVLRY